MKNPKKNKRRTPAKNLIIVFLIIIGLFFMKDKVNDIYVFISTVVEEINFKLVKVKKDLYIKRLNHISKWNDIKYLDKYIEKNKKRDLELQRIKLENIELENLKEENENLRKMLDMTQRNKVEYIAADVALVESFSNKERLFIDKGEKQGILLNLPVLFDGYLIGKISRVGDNYSEVMLLTNKHSKLSVILNNKNMQILRGNGNGTFSIFNYNEPVEEKELFNITTSGVSDLFPRGLKIGDFIIKDPNAFKQMREIRLKPSYKIFEIKNVLVYKWIKGDSPINEIEKQLDKEINEELIKNKGTSQVN